MWRKSHQMTTKMTYYYFLTQLDIQLNRKKMDLGIFQSLFRRQRTQFPSGLHHSHSPCCHLVLNLSTKGLNLLKKFFDPNRVLDVVTLILALTTPSTHALK